MLCWGRAARQRAGPGGPGPGPVRGCQGGRPAGRGEPHLEEARGCRDRRRDGAGMCPSLTRKQQTWTLKAARLTPKFTSFMLLLTCVSWRRSWFHGRRWSEAGNWPLCTCSVRTFLLRTRLKGQPGALCPARSVASVRVKLLRGEHLGLEKLPLGTVRQEPQDGDCWDALLLPGSAP